MTDITIALVAVGLISISCQYFAYKIKVPAILPLLIVGIIAGPITGFIDADAIFADLLFPVVSLCVAIILFEGSLTLKLSDISGHGKMVRNLCSLGALITMLTVAPAAHFALGISWELAFLFSALVTVTGPTVIVPMLRTVRPTSDIANILRWEGIIIDPIGALLAVIVFEYIISAQNALEHTFIAFALTLSVGALVGAVSGYLMGLALRHKLIPHYLTNTAVLTIMLGVFAFSNYAAHESGLITVTIMGMFLANMKGVDVDDILEFKETLSVLLISGLFILLASRIDLNAIVSVGWGAIIVLAVILFLARPLAVLSSSINTELTYKQIALLSWIAPRGIVAAAVSALFSIKLEEIGYPQAELLVPMVFLVIIITVVLQSLTAAKLASLLKLRLPVPNGILMFGGGQFSRQLAIELQRLNIPVCLADTNWETICLARMDGIPTYFGNPVSEHAERNLDLSLMGKVLILSPYKQLNPIVAFHFQHEWGKDSVLGLTNNDGQQRASHQASEKYNQTLCLFQKNASYGKLMSSVTKGAVIKTTRLTNEFTFADYEAQYSDGFIPLCCIKPNGDLAFINYNEALAPKADWQLVSLILKAD